MFCWKRYALLFVVACILPLSSIGCGASSTVADTTESAPTTVEEVMQDPEQKAAMETANARRG